MYSGPRWIISITDMPLPCQSSISSAAWRRTGSGRVAGPALKLKTRVIERSPGCASAEHTEGRGAFHNASGPLTGAKGPKQPGERTVLACGCGRFAMLSSFRLLVATAAVAGAV